MVKINQKNIDILFNTFQKNWMADLTVYGARVMLINIKRAIELNINNITKDDENIILCKEIK